MEKYVACLPLFRPDSHPTEPFFKIQAWPFFYAPRDKQHRGVLLALRIVPTTLF